jgi:hypothetical protein
MDIICISETWLNAQISDDQVDIKGYSIRRKDRQGHRACGAAIYITDALPHRHASELELPDIDLLWLDLLLGRKKVLVGATYRLPGQTQDEVDQFMSNLQDSFELAFQSNPESIFLMGDLNDTCAVWESDHPTSELGLKLYDFINSHDLHQLTHEPTFITSHSANILDLFITDSPGYIINQSQNMITPIGSSHLIIQAELKIQYRRDKTYLREIWNYK